jgi:hypothetical protein
MSEPSASVTVLVNHLKLAIAEAEANGLPLPRETRDQLSIHDKAMAHSLKVGHTHLGLEQFTDTLSKLILRPGARGLRGDPLECPQREPAQPQSEGGVGAGSVRRLPWDSEPALGGHRSGERGPKDVMKGESLIDSVRDIVGVYVRAAWGMTARWERQVAVSMRPWGNMA